MSIESSWAVCAVALLLPLSVTACAAPLDDPKRFAQGGDSGVGTDPAVCNNTTTMLFAKTCAITGCHSTMEMMASLDLQKPDPFARLKGKPATGGPGVIIDPGGDPMKSDLYLKLTPNPPFFSRMPNNGTTLDDATIACVAQWIMGQASSSDGGGSGPDAVAETGIVQMPGNDATVGGGLDDSPVMMEAATVPETGGGMPEAGSEAGASVTFTQVYSIMTSRCLPCHATGTGKTMGKLDLSTKAMAFTNLVGVVASGSACGTSGKTRVVPGNSAMSLLPQMLTATPPCGMQMPRTGGPLTAAQIAQISSWIDGGALNN
jgi:hypothetical protein